MYSQLVLLICFVGGIKTVFVDPNEGPYAGQDGAWKTVKTYHPPSPIYKYETYRYPKYEFEYSVSDKKTGDHKTHRESRDGDRVRGEYSLVEPDGSLRKVEYDADDHNGFSAVVSKGVHKHGDHAYSVFGHTRHFYPIGHGIKINHYFPEKNTAKDVSFDNTDKGKPVQENVQDSVGFQKSATKTDVETSDKEITLKPENAENVGKSNAERLIQKDLVAVVDSTTPLIIENEKSLEGSTEEINTVTTETSVTDAMRGEEIIKKDDPSPDNEVASSHYHMFYYVY
ncbi:uncharacterized protein LOC114243113 [Bombyx mandarina]|uniref:Uncharacterized protein LOC114243113 n=1 Tax=Bombyx mandarina TaxID=7092 RepID=A0A6J2JMN8_BOMMA|nr:uncharacterized protein LOC114243113 [Bombyx mandarina]